MTKTKFLAAGLLAAALLGHEARGQTAYNTGDLLLGLEKPGTTNQYVVDLGPASYFITLSESPGTITDITTSDYSGAGLGNIAADLANATSGFGSTWYANSATQGQNVQWGIFGATSNISGGTTGSGGTFSLPKNTLFETIAETVPGSGSTAPAEASSSGQGTVNSLFKSFAGSGGFKNSTETANSQYATFGPGITWTSEDPSADAFQIGNGIEQPQGAGITAIGPTNSELDLYELIPTGDTGSTGSGTELGSFTLDSSGNLDFTAAVPEPSTWAILGLGTGILAFARRNRRRA